MPLSDLSLLLCCILIQHHLPFFRHIIFLITIRIFVLSSFWRQTSPFHFAASHLSIFLAVSMHFYAQLQKFSCHILTGISGLEVALYLSGFTYLLCMGVWVNFTDTSDFIEITLLPFLLLEITLYSFA